MEEKKVPTELAEKNPHPRDNDITFDEGPHIYTVYGKQDYTSTTTWIHQQFSHFEPDKVIELFSKMIQHKHFIVGNSTFSLLAAALSEQDDSITIIASPWFRHKDKKNLSKENWIQIENK